MFSTRECAWAQTSVTILGRKVVGSFEFEFNLDLEKEHLFGAGSKPIDIQLGNETPTGAVGLYKYEVDLYNDAALAAGYANIGKVPHELIVITCTFKKSATSGIRTIIASGVAFTNLTAAMQQNAKNTQMRLPFLAMDIEYK